MQEKAREKLQLVFYWIAPNCDFLFVHH